MELFSQIIVTDSFKNITAKIERLAEKKKYELFTLIKDGNFLVQDVDRVIERAYTTRESIEIILIGADNFSSIVQNRLLKILEEPPNRKEFILLFKSKASILKTVRSRLPITVLKKSFDENVKIPNIQNLTIEECYNFVQGYRVSSEEDIKILIQKIFKEAVKSKKYIINRDVLSSFENSIKLINYGTLHKFILIGVLIKLLENKK